LHQQASKGQEEQKEGMKVKVRGNGIITSRPNWMGRRRDRRKEEGQEGQARLFLPPPTRRYVARPRQKNRKRTRGSKQATKGREDWKVGMKV
jgi:hypothetical protein